MKKSTFLFIIIFIACKGFPQLKNSIKRSVITFQAKNMGIAVNGTIGGLEADIQFNPASLATSTINTSVDVNTLNTDNDSRDEHLKSADFFDLAHYPKITLKSVSFKHKSGSNYTGQFNLCIKGKTKLIEVPFSYEDKSSSAIFKSNFKINRLDFGIGGSSIILSNEVIINIETETSK